MTDYTITTDFGAKDSLPSGNAAKVIKGSEFTTEFTNIKTAVNSKADSTGDTFTGAVTFDAAVTLNADVTFDTNTLFVDVSENRVGIGNVAPATALDVTGTVTASGLTVDTDTLHVDATNDRVGVGTTSPETSLHVDGGDVKISSDSATSNGDGKPTIFFSESGADEVYAQISYHGDDESGTNNFIGIGCSGAVGTTEALMKENHQMVVKASGNVGIGTSSPSALLHVKNNDAGFEVDVDNQVGDGVRLLAYDRNTSTDRNMQYRANQHLFNIGASEKMRIDSAGNVGIGTTSPDTLLELVGADPILTIRDSETTGANTNATLRLAESGASDTLGNYWDINHTGNGELRFVQDRDGVNNERMRINYAGNVGIGTTSPTYPLDIAGASSTTLSIRNTSTVSSILLSNGSSANQIFSRGANSSTGRDLAFVQGTSEAMRIDSSGYVGIGTTSPSTFNTSNGAGNLVVGSGSGAEGITVYSGTTSNGALCFADGTSSTDTYKGYVQYNHNTNSMQFATEHTERMRIDSSGNVGIGTSSPDSLLEVVGADPILTVRDTETGLSSTNATLRLAESGGGDALGNYWDINYTSNSALRVLSNTSERMRIDSSGNLLVGKTTNLIANVGGTIGSAGYITATRDGATPLSANRLTSDGAAVAFYKDSTQVGSISVTSSATTYNTSSDERLKENIQDADDVGSKIDAIQIRQFDWIADGLHQDYGVIAQELINVAPEAVSEGDTEEDMMGVDYSKLVPMLIKEVQTLRNRVAQLENN